MEKQWPIDIREFHGVRTEPDPEDIRPGDMLVCQNLRTKPGKLVKTTGFGEKIGIPASNRQWILDGTSLIPHDTGDSTSWEKSSTSLIPLTSPTTDAGWTLSGTSLLPTV